MSAVRRSQVEWWSEDDEQPTQAIPVQAARRATAIGRAAPLRTVPADLPARGWPSAAPRATPRRWALPAAPNLGQFFGKVTVVALLAFLLYLGLTALLGWVQIKLDDLHYGRPRTSQLDAFVGHNEATGTPTHFVALNLNRRVTIVEFPGGDVSKPQVLAGPYLFGQNEDLTVVKLHVEDLNGDGKPDLIAQVKGERLVYINDNGGFRPVTPDELAKLQAQQGGR